MQNGSGRPSPRPRPDGTANRRMFASIQSTLRSGKEFKSDAAGPSRNERTPRRREHTALVLKSVDEVIGQLADLEKRGEHSTSQIKQNLEASASTLAEMWDEEWAKLVEVLIKMCLESDEAVFVVDLLPIFMKYSDFLDLFRERMISISSEFVLGGEEEEGRRLEQVPSFLGSLLCARWPRGMHRDTLESNPVLFTAFEIVRGWMLVVEEASEGERDERRRERKEREAEALTETTVDRLMDELEEGIRSDLEEKLEQTAHEVVGEWERRQGGGEGKEEKPLDDSDAVDGVAEALRDGCKIGEGAASAADSAHSDGDEEEEAATTSPELLNRCCSALAAMCESQQRSLWLSRPELVDDMYKCIKLAITHNREIDGSVKSALLHTYLLMNEWTRSKAVTTKCAATQTAAS